MAFLKIIYGAIIGVGKVLLTALMTLKERGGKRALPIFFKGLAAQVVLHCRGGVVLVGETFAIKRRRRVRHVVLRLGTRGGVQVLSKEGYG